LLDFQQQADKFVASPATNHVFITYKRLLGIPAKKVSRTAAKAAAVPL
jgi:hypothetical protein